MPTVAVIPVRSFSVGNKRLSDTLDAPRRAALGRSLAERVGATVADAGFLPLFVTADQEVASWAGHAGFPFVTDPDSGLDDAATTGVAWAGESASNWIVLHADLPLLAAPDVLTLANVVESGRVVIAPSSDGGTSAIGGTVPIGFSYGTGSFHRHLSRMQDPVIVARTGLLHDLDSANDLDSASKHPRGAWLRSVLA